MIQMYKIGKINDTRLLMFVFCQKLKDNVYLIISMRKIEITLC